MVGLAELHDDLRPLMFSIAYRMLGSVAEAEDVVQEAFLRIHQTALDGTRVESPDAFATTVTTRLAIDALRSARIRRESYPGDWLPEPVADDRLVNPALRLELDESVSLAFLLVLERLSPVERAVFLLREVFGYGYDEIAAIVEKSEANCRQLFSRARRHIDEAGSRHEADPVRRTALAEQFFSAIREGDLAGLERMLAEDVVFYGDGGGKVAAVARPVSGRTHVLRFLLGIMRRGFHLGADVEPMHVNGSPALRLVDADRRVLGVMSLQLADGLVVAILNQINPDKLAHLGPVGDMNALMSTPPR